MQKILKPCVRALSVARYMRQCVYFSSLSVPNLFISRSASTSRNHVSEVYRLYASTNSAQKDLVDILTFERACEETLQSLTEYFEQIVEEADNLRSGDVSYSGGVLTINLGPQHGTYVINRQSPNRQIWLSSPVSGPKRYDFIVRDNGWVYKHDGRSLHELLQKEISKIVNIDVNFANCSYAKV